MNTLICTMGLPLAGKTTWAKAQDLPIVSPDAVRQALHGRRYWELAESLVWAHVWTMCRAMFLAGHYNVVLDATNTTLKRRNECREQGRFANTNWTCVFHHIATPAEICIERAVDMDDTFIVPVIERMAENLEPLTKAERL